MDIDKRQNIDSLSRIQKLLNALTVFVCVLGFIIYHYVGTLKTDKMQSEISSSLVIVRVRALKEYAEQYLRDNDSILGDVRPKNRLDLLSPYIGRDTSHKNFYSSWKAIFCITENAVWVGYLLPDFYYFDKFDYMRQHLFERRQVTGLYGSKNLETPPLNSMEKFYEKENDVVWLLVE
jgi:hypothetical protein